MKINIALGLILILAGCVNLAVDPQERDTSGQYAGIWRGKIELTRELQDHGTVKWTCPKFSLPISFRVRDGYVYGAIDRSEFSTPIGKAGNFYVNVDPENGRIYRFRGQLDAVTNTGQGAVVLTRKDADSRVQGTGCEAELTLTRS